MKRSNRLVILVGVLLAILAFVAIVILLNQPDPDTGGEEVEPETATVLVATQDIAVGDPVTPSVVEPREVSLEAVQGTALTDPSQVSGQPALFAIPQDAQVPGEAVNLGDEGDIDISRMLLPGEKAVAIRVDEQTGTGFLIQPSDTVDVVISTEVDVLQPTADTTGDPDAPERFEAVPGLEGQRTVKAVIQDRRVLYVSATRAEAPQRTDTNGDGVIDENDDAPAQAAIESVIVIVAMTAQEAEVVKFVQRDRSELSSERTEIPDSITLIIRNDDDDTLETTTGVTLDALVEEFGVRIPSIVDELGGEEPAP